MRVNRFKKKRWQERVTRIRRVTNAYDILVDKREREVATDLDEDGKHCQNWSFCVKYGGRMRKVYFHRSGVTRRVILGTIMNLFVL